MLEGSGPWCKLSATVGGAATFRMKVSKGLVPTRWMESVSFLRMNFSMGLVPTSPDFFDGCVGDEIEGAVA